MSATVIWFIIGVVCMFAEMISPVFVIFFFGLGAWAASLAMYFGASVAMSLGVFSVVSVASLFILRRLLIKTFQGSAHAAKDVSTQTGMHVGKKAVVTQMITIDKVGEVSLGGSYWRAVLDADSAASGTPKDSLEPGVTVVVSGHDPDDAILLLVRRL